MPDPMPALMMDEAQPLGMRVEQGLAARLTLLLHDELLPDLYTQPPGPNSMDPAAAGTAHEARAPQPGAPIELIASAWAMAPLLLLILVDQRLLDEQDDPRLHSRAGGLFDARAALLPGQDQRLLEVLRRVAALPAAAPIFGSENPLWRLPLSEDGAAALVRFFAARGLDDEPLYQFRDLSAVAQVLPDVYRALRFSEAARLDLIATPPFVARLLIDQTLDAALGTFNATQIRFLDPACGSGILPAFALERLVAAAPAGVDPVQTVRAALARVGGLDLSPHAVLLARFRLLLTALRLAGITKLRAAPALPLRVALADALLPMEEQALPLPLGIEDAEALLGGRYEAIACEPSFLTPKDPALRKRYRQYRSARGQYSLDVPFVERCFQLAVPGGSVGVLAANSFMMREFGKALVEKILAAVDLTLLVDSSGAYLPGHGTPTVLLFGRNQPPARSAVPVVSFAALASNGLWRAQEQRWQTLQKDAARAGFADDFISVDAIERAALARHPWSLGPRLRVLDLLVDQPQTLIQVCDDREPWDIVSWPHAAPPRAREAIVVPEVAREGPLPAAAVLNLWRGRIPRLRPELALTQRQGMLGFLCSSTAWCWLRYMATPSQGRFLLDEQVLRALPLPPLGDGAPPLWESLAAASAHLIRCAAERPDHFPSAVLLTPHQTGRALKRALTRAQQRENELWQELVYAQEEIDWLVYQLLGWHQEKETAFVPARVLPRLRPFAWLSEDPPELLPLALRARWTARRRALRAGGLHSPLRTLEQPNNKRPFSAHPARAALTALDYPQEIRLACEAWLVERLRAALGARTGEEPALEAVATQLGAEAPVLAVLDVYVWRGERELLPVLRDLYEREVRIPPPQAR